MADSENELCFVDTNLWLYAFVESEESIKSNIARELVRTTNIALSVQVVNEVCFNLIRKASFPEEQIERLIESFYSKYRVLELSQEILTSASRLRGMHSFSFWDSMIVAAALEAKAKILYSEDMQDGLVVQDQLQLVNPFRK